jgi:precorrin-2 methylase
LLVQGDEVLTIPLARRCWWSQRRLADTDAAVVLPGRSYPAVRTHLPAGRLDETFYVERLYAA